MKFTDLFIKRPVLAVSLSLLLVILGLHAALQMQVREYPKMTNTVVSVSTGYYGASADLVQGFITQPLEQAIAQADNIDYMTSSSAQGSSNISVHMKLNTDPNAALAEIMSKANSVNSQLPHEAENPSITMDTGGGTGILYIGFNSGELDVSQIYDYLQRVVSPQLFTVSGISGVDIYGTKYAIRIWLDPQKMAMFNLGTKQVLQALRTNNYQSATGQIIGEYVLFNTEANTQVSNAKELGQLVLKSNDGQQVHLSDIASITLAKSHDVVRATANGKKTVVISIKPTPTANPIDIAKDVRKLLPSIEKNLPNNIKMHLLYDSTLVINDSIDEVVKTIAEAAVIVLLVITLFLGSLRAVIIPIITIPLSLIGIAFIMQSLDFTWNLMTLLAMVLAIGLVVDDAIVVLENVDRHIKQGETPFRAAIIGTREIALPVISMTVTLAAVYAPIALMGGITGSLFKEFALTLAGSVFISGIIALTLSPVMCAKLLKDHENENENKFMQAVQKALQKLELVYTTMLRKLMTMRSVVVVFALIVLVMLPVLFKLIPSELAPGEDQGVVLIMGTAPANANIDFVETTMQQVNKILAKQDGVEFSQVMSGMPDSNQAFGLAILQPWSQRTLSQKQIAKQLEKKLKQIPSMSLVSFPLPALPGTGGGLPIQLAVMTPNDFVSLYKVMEQVLIQVEKNPMFVYSELDLNFESATVKIRINKDKANVYGISLEDIGTTIATMLSDGYISRINLGGRAYEVIPQTKRIDRLNPEKLNSFYITSSNGQQVPLSELVSLKIKTMPKKLSHLNQLNSATIGAVAIGPIGDAINALDQIAAKTLPSGYTYDYLGQSRQYIQEGNSLYITFGLSLAIIFLVLAMQFESWRDPLVILVSVPLAISGALIALTWGLATLNIYSQIGLVTLIGLITKHGILICEVAKDEQLLKQSSRIDAVIYAASIRLRPILMTTAATIAGLAPLLHAVGAGAAQRFSIGIVVVVGMGVGTLFTLFVLPVIYTFIASVHQPLPIFKEETKEDF